MTDCYITFRTVTRAQKAQKILESGRIQNRLVRAPKTLSAMGCAHALLVPQRSAATAAELLREQGGVFEHIMRPGAGGEMEELRV